MNQGWDKIVTKKPLKLNNFLYQICSNSLPSSQLCCSQRLLKKQFDMEAREIKQLTESFVTGMHTFTKKITTDSIQIKAGVKNYMNNTESQVKIILKDPQERTKKAQQSLTDSLATVDFIKDKSDTERKTMIKEMINVETGKAKSNDAQSKLNYENLEKEYNVMNLKINSIYDTVFRRIQLKEQTMLNIRFLSYLNSHSDLITYLKRYMAWGQWNIAQLNSDYHKLDKTFRTEFKKIQELVRNFSLKAESLNKLIEERVKFGPIRYKNLLSLKKISLKEEQLTEDIETLLIGTEKLGISILSMIDMDKSFIVLLEKDLNVKQNRASASETLPTANQNIKTFQDYRQNTVNKNNFIRIGRRLLSQTNEKTSGSSILLQKIQDKITTNKNLIQKIGHNLNIVSLKIQYLIQNYNQKLKLNKSSENNILIQFENEFIQSSSLKIENIKIKLENFEKNKNDILKRLSSFEVKVQSSQIFTLNSDDSALINQLELENLKKGRDSYSNTFKELISLIEMKELFTSLPETGNEIITEQIITQIEKRGENQLRDFSNYHSIIKKRILYVNQEIVNLRQQQLMNLQNGDINLELIDQEKLQKLKSLSSKLTYLRIFDFHSPENKSNINKTLKNSITDKHKTRLVYLYTKIKYNLKKQTDLTTKIIWRGLQENFIPLIDQIRVQRKEEIEKLKSLRTKNHELYFESVVQTIKLQSKETSKARIQNELKILTLKEEIIKNIFGQSQFLLFKKYQSNINKCGGLIQSLRFGSACMLCSATPSSFIEKNEKFALSKTSCDNFVNECEPVWKLSYLLNRGLSILDSFNKNTLMIQGFSSTLESDFDIQIIDYLKEVNEDLQFFAMQESNKEKNKRLCSKFLNVLKLEASKISLNPRNMILFKKMKNTSFTASNKSRILNLQTSSNTISTVEQSNTQMEVVKEEGMADTSIIGSVDIMDQGGASISTITEFSKFVNYDMVNNEKIELDTNAQSSEGVGQQQGQTNVKGTDSGSSTSASIKNTKNGKSLHMIIVINLVFCFVLSSFG